MPSIEVAGRSASFEVVGEGDEAVVLVHSSGLGSGQWRKTVALLADAGYRVVVPDLFGYGASDPWPSDEPFEVHADAALVRAVVEAVPGEGTVHLVGHSYGAVVAALAAKDARGRVGRLVLFEPVLFGVDPSASPEPAVPMAVDEAFFSPDADGGLRGFVARVIDFWNGPGAWSRRDPVRRTPFLAAAHKMRAEVHSVASDPGLADDLATLRHPVLLLSGGRTFAAAGRVACEALARRLPDARHVVVEDAGHTGPITHADVVGPLTLGFLRGEQLLEDEHP